MTTKFGGKSQVEAFKHVRDNNIKMDLKETRVGMGTVCVCVCVCVCTGRLCDHASRLLEFFTS
jgi:hypothetical protein